jgi:methyl-accepting chemotaxis protein
MSLFSMMRGFTIRTRMFSAIGVVLLLLLMVGGVGLYGLLHNADTNAEYQARSFKAVGQLARMHEALGQVRTQEKDIVLMARNPAAQASAIQAWRTAIGQLGDLARGLQADAALQELSRYQAALESQLPLISAETTQRQEAVAALAPALAAAEQITRHLGAIDRAMTEQAAASLVSQAQNVDRTIALFVGAVVLSLIVVAPTTILNQICICQPIDQARQLASSIAQGHLNNTVDVQGSDEATALLRALDDMQRSLRGIVSNVRVSADSISFASSDIATGNTELSSRTESTASSLQQTSVSMDGLTGTVKNSAAAALQANELAQGAASAAHRGSSIVFEVVSNMGEIDGTSKRINDIIGVIDGIAFQTNILALNAAVEAARAGEQGRGFAVVAGEVRSLAQRSATAAREIKQFIQASVETVESGTRLVHDAGSAMQEIIASVQKVSDIIGEIASASNEQSNGIGQINQAVTDLDHMTQQNAALVQQSAAAAASLKEQSHKLTQAMAVFDIGHG